ncbi:MAG: hypothetical protein ACK4UN_00065 [Limisphaerales bacterium]
MAGRPKSRFWRIARVTFRWCRIAVWLVILALLVSVVYLSTVGLPDFLKAPLVAELRARGWEVEFSSMRWHWYRGVVLEKATFSSVDKTSPSTFSAEQAELNVDFSRIRESKVTLKSILINSGEFTSLLETNTTPIRIEKIQAKVFFHPEDRVTIEPFEAQFRGIQFRLSCDLSNVSALSELSFLLPEKAATDPSETALKKWFEIADQIQFLDEPEVSLDVRGDLHEWQKMKAQLKVATLGATTPWGRFEGVGFTGEMNPRSTTNFPVFAFQLNAADLQSDWGMMKSLQHRSQFSLSVERPEILECDFELSGNQIRGRWNSGNATNLLRAGRVHLSGASSLSLTDFQPITARSRLQLRQTNVRLQPPGQTNIYNATLNHADLEVKYDPAAAPMLAQTEELGFWTHLLPFTISGQFDFGRLGDQRLNFNKLLVSADWAWPRVELLDLQSGLYGGEFVAGGHLNVQTREVELNARSTFDVQKLSPLLPGPGQRFLADWELRKPPVGAGVIRFVLPEWTNAAPDLKKEFLPTLQIDAQVSLEQGSYHRVFAEKASTSIHYSNMVWRLPDIKVQRPDGEVDITLLADDRELSFEFTVNGAVDPNNVRPHLDAEQAEWLDQVSFSNPPHVQARIRGNWGELESLGVEGVVHTGDFVCRGVSFSSLQTAIHYTNLVFDFTETLLKRGERQIKSDRITLNLQTNRIYFNDVASTIDPMLVAQVIGEVVEEVLSPYKFESPPNILLNGSLGLLTIDDADMHFDIAGQNFRWGYLRADTGSGRASWVNQTLILTNLNAIAYGGGKLQGNGFVDFEPKGKADYRLDVTFTNVDVHTLVRSLDGTNQVEGLLSGALTLDAADTRGLQTWNGYGHGELKDGLIWEMPIFGLFSPILEAIMPGLGKNRARSATAHFVITNGVAYSDDLEIRSSGFRMQYRGTLSHELEVNARVLAEPLRDTWAVGRAISTALMPLSKLFEYRVTGPVYDPDMKPVYVPKIVMMTLRPFNTLKKLLPHDKDEVENETLLVPAP